MIQDTKKTTRPAFRLTFVAVIAAICLGGAAVAFGAPAMIGWNGSAGVSAVKKGSRVLSLRARPGQLVISPGSPVTFELLVRRGWRRHLIGQHGLHRIAAGVNLAASHKLPPGIRVAFTSARTRNMKTSVTFAASSVAEPGTRHIRINARGRLRIAVTGRTRVRRAHTFVSLVVAEPDVRSFQIQGEAVGELSPGVSVPVDVRVTNPESSAMSLKSLETSVDAVNAPGAVPGLPCSVADFHVSQLEISEPLDVPASSTTSLGALGIPESEWPRIHMLRSSTNQDGCRRATLELGFVGTSTGGDQ